MPTPASIAAKIHREGQLVTFARTAAGTTVTVAGIKAFVHGYQPKDLIGGIILGDRVLHVVPSDLTAAGWPSEPRKPDLITIAGKTTTVQSCETRRLRGTPVAHIVQVRGG